jgi:hypothetical protein
MTVLALWVFVLDNSDEIAAALRRSLGTGGKEFFNWLEPTLKLFLLLQHE